MKQIETLNSKEGSEMNTNVIHKWTDKYGDDHRLIKRGGRVEEQIQNEQYDWHVATKRHSDAVNELGKAIERIKELDDRTTWQPIETCPQDGTPCLFYTPEDDEEGYIAFVCVSSMDSRGELDDYRVHQWQDGLRPTHWMPLPELPEELEKE